MNYCHQCGTKLEPGARFCPECGYDTSAYKADADMSSNPFENPDAVNKPEPQPVPTLHSTETPPRKKGMKPWLWVVVIVVGVGALGAAGWFGYNKLLAPEKKITDETIVNESVSKSTSIDLTEGDAPATIPPKATGTEKPKPKTSTPVKSGSDVKKPKAKPETKETVEPVKPAEQEKKDVTPAKREKEDPGVKESAKTTVKDKKIKVLVEVGRTKNPKDMSPKNPVKLTISKPTMVVRITTDHFNGGKGTSSPGTISIKDSEGKTIGSFRAQGQVGSDGIPNVKWVAEPGQLLEKGTYYIWDSDMSTWSKTPAGGAYIIVEGYEVK